MDFAFGEYELNKFSHGLGAYKAMENGNRSITWLPASPSDGHLATRWVAGSGWSTPATPPLPWEGHSDKCQVVV